MGQNLVPLVNIKIAGKWMFIPLKMVLIGIDPYPFACCFALKTGGNHSFHQTQWIKDIHDEETKTNDILITLQ